MYTYETRVGFSQVDSKKRIKLEALTNLFQDATCFQGEEIGAGFAYLEPKKQAWVLNSWQIDVDRFPEFNEKITVGTFPTGFRGFLGNRNFFVMDEKKEMIVMAHSIWTLMDMENMRPTRLTPEYVQKYTLEEPLPMEYASRKILIPDGDEWEISTKDVIRVSEYHLDSNMHVNNGQYVQMAGAYFDRDIRYDRMRVEYRKQAHLGDVILPVVYKKENACIVSLCDTENKPYAVIEAGIRLNES